MEKGHFCHPSTKNYDPTVMKCWKNKFKAIQTAVVSSIVQGEFESWIHSPMMPIMHIEMIFSLICCPIFSHIPDGYEEG